MIITVIHVIYGTTSTKDVNYKGTNKPVWLNMSFKFILHLNTNFWLILFKVTVGTNLQVRTDLFEYI